VDLEVLDVAFRYTGDGVGQQRSRQTVLGALLTIVAATSDGEYAVFDGDVELGVDVDQEGALRPLYLHVSTLAHLGLDTLGQGYRSSTDTRHHHTSQMISPPTLPLRASRSAIRPREVETMATPRPPRITGTCSDL